jgi:hypothetical protein
MKLFTAKPLLVLALLLSMSTISAAQPLKDILLLFADSQPDEEIKLVEKRISGFKNGKWAHEISSGKIKIALLGDVQLSFTEKSRFELYKLIHLYSSKPNKRFKQILDAELGHGVVTEIKGCKNHVVFDQKKFQINLKNKKPIYVSAVAVMVQYPNMALKSTSFSFYVERPLDYTDDWECNGDSSKHPL